MIITVTRITKLYRKLDLSISRALSNPVKMKIERLFPKFSGFSITYDNRKKKKELMRISKVSGIRILTISTMILITLVKALITERYKRNLK